MYLDTPKKLRKVVSPLKKKAKLVKKAVEVTKLVIEDSVLPVMVQKKEDNPDESSLADSDVKKQWTLVKRAPTFFMNGNAFLINKTLSYMSIKDILSLMSVNRSTLIAVKNNKTFWFDYYKIIKFGRLQNRYNYQHKGPICYGCIDVRFSNRPPPHDFWMNHRAIDAGIDRHMVENMKDVPINHEDLVRINGRRYTTFLETMTMNASLANRYLRYQYALSRDCAKSHWARKPYYSRKYRGVSYDNNVNYYNLCLLSLVNSKFLAKHKLAAMNHTWAQRRLTRYKRNYDVMQNKFTSIDNKLSRLNRVKDYYNNVVLKELV